MTSGDQTDRNFDLGPVPLCSGDQGLSSYQFSSQKLCAISTIINSNPKSTVASTSSSVSQNNDETKSSKELVQNQISLPKRKSLKTLKRKLDNDDPSKNRGQKIPVSHQRLPIKNPASKSSGVESNNKLKALLEKSNRRKKLVKKLVLYKKKMREKKNAQQILTEKVLSNHVMVRIIFQNLSFKDILQCSLVSKTWLAHSRLTLRKDKRATARLVSFSSSCHNLKAFNVMIDKCGPNIPFNGLSIFDYCRRSCRHVAPNKSKMDENDPTTTTITTHHPSTSFLFNPNVSIKYLRLVGYQVNEDCPIFHIVQKILTTFSHNLLEISIGSVTFEGPQNPLQLIKSLQNNQQNGQSTVPKVDPATTTATANSVQIQNKELTSLTTLEILGVGYYPRSLGGHGDEGQQEAINQTIEVISDILNSAPNLSKIYGDITPELTPNILAAGKAMIVKKFNFTPTKPEHLTNTIEFGTAAELRQLNVSTFSVLFSAPMNSIMETSRLLYTSCCGDTLKSLRLGHADLLMLIDSSMPPLPSLVEMKVTFYKKLNDLMPARSLARLNWAQKFPVLNTVFVERADISSRRRRDRFVQEFHQRWAHLGQPRPTWSIKKVNFNLYTYLPLADDQEGLTVLDSFSSPFVNVTHLYLNATPQLPNLLIHLWTHWIHLESLTLTGVRDTEVYGNLDWVFLGIPKDQWQQVREEVMTIGSGIDDMAKLKNLMDLRTEPSIHNLKKLKLLRIHIQHTTVKCGQDDELEDEYQEGDGGMSGVSSGGLSRPVFITEVTGNIAFSEMSGLTVEICRKTCSGANDTKCLFSMDSIAPFANIIEMLPTGSAGSWTLKMIQD